MMNTSLGFENFNKSVRLQELASAREVHSAIASIHSLNRKKAEDNETLVAGAKANIEQAALTRRLLAVMEAQGKRVENLETRVSELSYQYDVFISHADADKTGFVDELCHYLEAMGVRIWYDKNVLEWGDKWKNQIEHGLEDCRFGIAIISPAFLNREWTEKELFALLNRQNKSGQKIVLPLLLGLNIDEVKSRYPDLGEIQMISADKTSPLDIAHHFNRLLLNALRK